MREFKDHSFTYFSMLVATIAVLALVLWLGDRSYRGAIDDRHRAEQAKAREAAQAEGLLVVNWIDGAVPTDPDDPRWSEAEPREVALQPQQMAMPFLATATVTSAEVRGLVDGERIAWRIRWEDDGPDVNVDANRFSDAVGLQFPLGVEAPFSMGAEKQPVHILHWKALWQRDVDEHFQDVQDLHPNFWADKYWFAEGSLPYRVPEAFQRPEARAYLIAYSAGNPMAQWERSTPVEELTAAGFGSSTHQPLADASGAGRYGNRAWTVVIERPMRTADPFDKQFYKGETSDVALAIWNGGDGHVGGRKQWSNWVRYRILP